MTVRTHCTTPRLPEHVKDILLWIAVWCVVLFVLRAIGWGLDEACETAMRGLF